uniref:Chemokine interleukin-8-like domain-containing protein n=1 Tax=Poecilia reticulata TaxID=8081 RepID=A0A3P9QDL8_POERE
MKAVNILLLCILGAALLSTVLCQCNGPIECCFEFFRNPVNKKLINSYYRTDPRCATSGVVLITRRARRICVDSKEDWVQNIVENLERKSL